MLLAGDIGGTHTRLALFAPDGAPGPERTFLNRDLTDLASGAHALLEAAGSPRVIAAALAIAGPVLDGRVQMTNLDWVLDERELGETLGGARVRLLNDLEAAAYGVLGLPPEELRALEPGRPSDHGNLGVIAAGTGLGTALLAWNGDVPVAIASEGGHVDFAPRDALESALHAWLAARYGHVSIERVVSGPGLVHDLEFLHESGRGEMPAALRDRLATATDPGAEISRAALAGEFPICVRALEVFVDAYGAAAGNLALVGLTTGGLYVAGGIAPHVLVGRWGDRFLEAFRAKGRYRDLLARVPVSVVVSERAALAGARAVAMRLSG